MEIDLLDPGPFGRNDFWPTFTWLRAHSPVHWHPEPGSDDGGFWVLSRHRDIMKVYADSDTFSSARGMRLGSDPAAVAAVAQRMLIVSDVRTTPASSAPSTRPSDRSRCRASRRWSRRWSASW